MFAARRMRKVFSEGGGTYESAKIVAERKSYWMVHYLRARRMMSTPTHKYIRDAALREKKWVRAIYLKEI